LFQAERIDNILRSYNQRAQNTELTLETLNDKNSYSRRSSSNNRSKSEKNDKDDEELPTSEHDMKSIVGRDWGLLQPSERAPFMLRAKQLEIEALDFHTSTHGTERSKAQTQTTSSTIQKLLHKLKHEDDYDLSIMRLKNHGLPPNINGPQMNRVLEALMECNTIQVLYIQNLADGMRDEQLRRLMSVSFVVDFVVAYIFLFFISFFF